MRSSATTARPGSARRRQPRGRWSQALEAPRVVWVMVPSGEPTRATVTELGELLERGRRRRRRRQLEVHRRPDPRRGARPEGHRLRRRRRLGRGLGPGERLRADGRRQQGRRRQGAADLRRPQAAGEVEEADSPAGAGAGFVHAGPVGAGHYAKMVHNGIEYALMQAYGEGYELLAAKDLIEDVPGVIASWTQGTVIRSWLLDLLVRALQEDPGLDQITGYAEDSGEGRWTVEEAIDNAVPMPAIAASLFARFASRQDDSPTMKAVAALRNQFGGHAVHAVRAAGGRRSPRLNERPGVPAASAAGRVPQLGEGRPRAAARPHRGGRPQRRGQDQPGRGGRLPRHPRQPPGGHRRPAGPARRTAGRGPGGAAPRRARAARRGRDQPGPGQPGAAQPLAAAPAPRAARAGARRCCSRPRTSRWSRGDPSERRRFLDELLVSRTPRLAGVRATTTGCSSSATPC